MECNEVFSTHEFDVGCSKSTRHTIKTTYDKPFRERSRRFQPADVEALRQNLSQLKDAGIITESLRLTHCGGEKEEWKNKDVCGLQDSKPPHCI